MINKKFYIPEITKPQISKHVDKIKILPTCPISDYIGIGIESNRFIDIPIKDEYCNNIDTVLRIKENGSLYKKMIEMISIDKLPKCWIDENGNK
ncbi:MAG: hypothetical protein RL308_3385 [Bacteroidota bacterium]|jgi:hypothetical protein